MFSINRASDTGCATFVKVAAIELADAVQTSVFKHCKAIGGN